MKIVLHSKSKADIYFHGLIASYFELEMSCNKAQFNLTPICFSINVLK